MPVQPAQVLKISFSFLDVERREASFSGSFLLTSSWWGEKSSELGVRWILVWIPAVPFSCMIFGIYYYYSSNRHRYSFLCSRNCCNCVRNITLLNLPNSPVRYYYCGLPYAPPRWFLHFKVEVTLELLRGWVGLYIESTVHSGWTTTVRILCWLLFFLRKATFLANCYLHQ